MSFRNNPQNVPVVIFYPKNKVNSKGYLNGEIKIDGLLKTINIFIYDVDPTLKYGTHPSLIGVSGNDYSLQKARKNWVKLQFLNNIPHVYELLCNNETLNPKNCLIIFYDKSHFLESELLSDLESETNQTETCFDDHFKNLDYSLKCAYPSRNQRDIPVVIKFILIGLIVYFGILHKLLSYFHPLFKLSSLVNHMYIFVKSMIWGLKNLLRRKRFASLKEGNFIFGVIGDWAGGLLLICWILNMISIEDMLQTLALQSEVTTENFNLPTLKIRHLQKVREYIFTKESYSFSLYWYKPF